MLGFFTSLFSSGATKAIENIAKECIDTPEEKAQAKALMVKTLDPNGLMRRQISNTVSKLYVLYILVMLILLVMQSFDVGNTQGIANAITVLKDLFDTITMSFGAIVGASFGVNGVNSFKEK